MSVPSRPGAAGARRRMPAADTARVAVFAALIAVLGLPGSLYLLGNAVPVTLQTLGVMLTGAILGARRGMLAVVVFLALVAVGLPLLAGGRGGLGVFAGPSVGFLVGFVAGAGVTGWIVERGTRRTSPPRLLVACLVGGVAVMYAFGIPGQALVLGLPLSTAALGALAFLPGDVLKVVVAASIAGAVQRAYPDASPVVRRERPETVRS